MRCGRSKRINSGNGDVLFSFCWSHEKSLCGFKTRWQLLKYHNFVYWEKGGKMGKIDQILIWLLLVKLHRLCWIYIRAALDLHLFKFTSNVPFEPRNLENLGAFDAIPKHYKVEPVLIVTLISIQRHTEKMTKGWGWPFISLHAAKLMITLVWTSLTPFNCLHHNQYDASPLKPGT